MKRALKIGGMVIGALVILAIAGALIFKKEIQSNAVRRLAAQVCLDKLPADVAPCLANIDAHFDRCVEPLLAKEMGPPDFMQCLGVQMAVDAAPERQVVVECGRENFRAKSLDLTIAYTEPADGRRVIEWQGQKYYLAREPVVTIADFERFALLKEDDYTFLEGTFSEDGGKRLSEATGKNVDGYMAILLNGEVESLPKIMAKLESKVVTFSLSRLPAPEAVCPAKA